MISPSNELNYIYIAGPYANGDTILNIRRAVMAAEELISYRFIPFIPHLNFFWHALYPHNKDYWMQWDSQWLLRCDAVLRLKGHSIGADAEVMRAQDNNIPVFYSIDPLLIAASESRLSGLEDSEPNQGLHQDY